MKQGLAARPGCDRRKKSKPDIRSQATVTADDLSRASSAAEGQPKKKGVITLPSHWGPKVRHKPRQAVKEITKKKTKVYISFSGYMLLG